MDYYRKYVYIVRVIVTVAVVAFLVVSCCFMNSSRLDIELLLVNGILLEFKVRITQLINKAYTITRSVFEFDDGNNGSKIRIISHTLAVCMCECESESRHGSIICVGTTLLQSVIVGLQYIVGGSMLCSHRYD